MPLLTDLLTDAELTALRAGYDRKRMVEDVRTTLEVAWPDATPLVESVLVGFYLPQKGGKWRMPPATRERVVLSLLANGAGQPFDVAAHVYWALMEKLSVQEVLDTILLTASYGGVARYTDNFKLTAFVLGLLKGLVAEGVTDCSAVMARISASFPASPVQVLPKVAPAEPAAAPKATTKKAKKAKKTK